MSHPSSAVVVGIDIGGTFTDCVAIDGHGEIYTAKASTTPDQLSDGVLRSLDSIAAAVAAKHGTEARDVLGEISLFINGNTVATNVLAQMSGAEVGLLTTKGFEDVTRIARSNRSSTLNNHEQLPLPPLVQRRSIVGITERVDRHGHEVVPLNEEEVREAARYLVEERGVDAIAVAFLWSFRVPEHELRAGAIIHELYPHIRVSLSHIAFPAIREYERTITTLMDAYTAPKTLAYIRDVENGLRSRGVEAPLRLMTCRGGCVDTEEAALRPITQYSSGPVGGVVGANGLGRSLGIENMITADVGGTSFDAAVIYQNKLRFTARAYIPAPGYPGPGWLTGLDTVDIHSVGAGGGSIAWIDGRGLLQVGPRSAGSQPGPVCFGRGGAEPTLTDACVALGIIDSEYFLGGTMKIDREAAERAIEERVAKPLHFTVEEAAAGIYRIATTHMASAVNSLTVKRGLDPRDFTMVSYGGAGGMILPRICQETRVSALLVPQNAAVFSARGLLAADYRRNYLQGIHWRSGGDPSGLADAFATLERRADEDAQAVGLEPANCRLSREVDVKFVGQTYELRIEARGGPVDEAWCEDTVQRFKDVYAAEYGSDAIWLGVDPEILNVRVTLTSPLPTPTLASNGRPVPHSDASQLAATRRVVLPWSGQTRNLPIIKTESLPDGASEGGPLILESADTTIFVPDEMWVQASGENLLIRPGSAR
jgi:N-methylhydantoinase A